MTAKAITYAEEDLGIHKVYESAKVAANSLDECLTKLSEQRDRKRLTDQTIIDREMELAEAERGKHPDMSQAAMDKHLKVLFNKDEFIRELTSHLRDILSEIDGLECDRDIFETEIKINTARMFELGGYMQYLAAVKLKN